MLASEGGAPMDLPALYDEDLHAWALHQAEALRRLKAAGLPLPNDLDLENVAEEIEDLGNEQRFQVESNLEQALAHLIKLALRPEDDAARHWSSEVAGFLGTALKRYRPSMRRALDLEEMWRLSCRRARLSLGLPRGEPAGLPAAMPFTLEELLADDADPNDLAAKLAGTLGANA
jgi:hypothetical protein